jgi:hypothetical protein
MSPRKKRKSARARRGSTSLARHLQTGKQLMPPLAQLPVSLSHWDRDVLPEMLWVDAALDKLGWDRAPGPIRAALDAIEGSADGGPKGAVLSGLISSFSAVPSERRPTARAALRNLHLDDATLPEPFRHALGLYPECPAAWLIEDWRKTNRVDPEIGIGHLKAAVLRLFDSKSVYSTRCRMLPLGRLIERGKIHLPRQSPIVHLFSKYPAHLSDDEQRAAESMARATFGGISRLMFQETEWAQYFWRHNYEISVCQPVGYAPTEGQPLGKELSEAIIGQMLHATGRLRSVIDKAATQAPLDIYEINKDEVLFGLLSRQFRLFTAVASDIRLWAPDLGRMLLRPMADGLITLKWLISRNDPALFDKFKTFSAGKRKLLKLHMEEFADGARLDLAELESYLSDSVNEEIWEELLPIDLGVNFADTNMRKMALEVELGDLYNLVFSPSSGEVHGEWMSLKEFNLQRCGNPLHRFHRLPRLSPLPLLDPSAVLQAASILAATFQAWSDTYRLVSPHDALEEFLEAVHAALELPHRAAAEAESDA